MNVLPEDRYKAAALEKGCAHCMKKALEANQKGIETKLMDHFLESNNWLIEARRCQRELDELKAKKDELERADLIYLVGRVLGRCSK